MTNFRAQGRFVDKKPTFSDLADDRLAKEVAKGLGYKVQYRDIDLTGCQKLSEQAGQNGHMRGARRPMSGAVLCSYVDAKSDERNEADGRFSAAC